MLLPEDAPLSAEQARAFWYGLINYEIRSPAPDDLKLDRMRALLSRLGEPQRRYPILHVAGTKGKGSTAAMLAAVLRSAGCRVGLFTSPHLRRVEERMQVDGEPISTPELTTLLDEVRRATRPRGGGPDRFAGLTFFEVATALGFLHFARRRADVAVVEVGLGGRFDSTNVCEPEVALITSISFDHTAILGDRLSSIAFEKAGIVKPGRPAVSGAVAPEARSVIEDVCRRRGAALRQLGGDFRFSYQPGQVTATTVRKARVSVTTWRRRWPELELNLLGEHQAANAAVAVACVEVLRERGWTIPDAAVAAGLAGVSWPARMEVRPGPPLTVLDCAHNVASAQAVVDTLRTSFPPGRRVLLFGGSGDKDLAGMFRVLAPHFAHVILTRFTENPRAMPPERLLEMLRRVSEVPAELTATSAAAWRAAQAAAGRDDLIVATGSVFLAGELHPLLFGQRAV
jgi:dihydrofolate synthase/folylpolyglutamate synthase